MKTRLLFVLSILVCAGIQGQTIIIGTGSESKNYPFSMEDGYTRSAAIYTNSEINGSKLVTNLSWYVTQADVETAPVKIYLKNTTDATLSTDYWNNVINGATMVYNGTLTFTSLEWNTIDIADFVYLSTIGGNDQNLLVLCEVNYGGNGPISAPWFANTPYSFSQHEFWTAQDSPPVDPGTVNDDRPNIMITYTPVSNPAPPSGFMAQAVSSTEIDLVWTKNTSNHNVMVAFNTVNTFGTPSGMYAAGNTITGGGTVIYNGSASNFSHTSGLNPSTTYYYMAWSVMPSTPTYSSGVEAATSTQCGTISNFPYLTDFESTTFPPLGWSMAGVRWLKKSSVSAYGTGTGSVYADFYNSMIPIDAIFDLISPTLDLTSLSSPYVSFDHAYATFSTEVDKLELWYSTNNGASYTLLTTWLGGESGPLNTGGTTGDPFVPTSGQWASKSASLPAGTNRIYFRGINAFGNNLFLDNILICEPIIEWNGGTSGQWTNPLNWTPNGVPGGTQNITIPSGKPNNPVISSTGNECKNLVIQNGATLTISSSPTGSITVMGNLTIEGGATLTNNGSMIIKGNLNNQNQK